MDYASPVKTRSNTVKHTASTFHSLQNHSYSRDRNLWHISHEGLELEDPVSGAELRPSCSFLVSHRRKLRMKAEYVTMTFEKGVPVSLNGKKMKVSDIITELNTLGGKTRYRYH